MSIPFGDAGACFALPEYGKQNEVRSLRGLRIVRSLRKSTVDCTPVKHESAELMLRIYACTMLILRDSAYINPAACITAMPCNKMGMDIPQKSQKSQNSHIARLHPAVRPAAMPGMSIPFGDAGAWDVPVEHGRQTKVRKLRALRKLKNLSII